MCFILFMLHKKTPNDCSRGKLFCFPQISRFEETKQMLPSWAVIKCIILQVNLGGDFILLSFRQHITIIFMYRKHSFFQKRTCLAFHWSNTFDKWLLSQTALQLSHQKGTQAPIATVCRWSCKVTFNKRNIPKHN